MTGSTGARLIALAISWALLGMWAVTSALLPGTPSDEIATGAGLLYMFAAIFHVCAAVGARGAGKLITAAFLIAFAFECMSIHTGFPFGFYEHGDVMGLKVARTPLLVAFGYFAIAWPAWLIARLALGEEGGASLLWTPLLTALIATSFDAASDAIGSTVRGYWAYGSPTGFFGVPLTNYFGWLLTTFAIGLAFSAITRRHMRLPPRSTRLFWALPPVFWILFAAQYALYPLVGPAAAAPETVELAGRVWRVADIYEASAMVAILTMLPAALIALVRLGQRTDRRKGDSTGRTRHTPDATDSNETEAIGEARTEALVS